MAYAKCSAWPSGPRKPSRSGPRFCARSRVGDCAGVKLVISDAHEGTQGRRGEGSESHLATLQSALPAQRPGARGQGSAADGAGHDQHRVRPGQCAEAASAQWRTVADQLRAKFPKLAALMEGSEADVLAFMSFPKPTARRSTAPTRSSGSTPRSSDVPTSWASSRTKRPSRASSGRCCSSKTTSGSCSVDTCSLKAYRL